MVVTRSGLATVGAVFLGVLAVAGAGWLGASSTQRSAVLSLVSPGPLSAAHAPLARDCTGCHSPGEGVVRANCVSCHASSPALLDRQPTRFHTTVATCASCHVEHRGVATRPISMDHEVLLTRPGTQLDCASCHATVDPHRENFGRACQACHVTDSWEVPPFQHPSSRSTRCADCHNAPPSHLMEHFSMVSQRVARRPDASVTQCAACHHTTSWNEIVGVGWYKHH